MKIFGVEIKTRNKREEKLVRLIRFNIILTTIDTVKTHPSLVKRDAAEIVGQITALYFMEMVSMKDFSVLNDRCLDWEWGIVAKAASASQSFRKGGAAA